MKQVICVSALVLALAGAVAAQPHSQGWATMGDFGNFHIVASEDATEGEKLAASLFQEYWRDCTGHELGVSANNEGDINVWLGRSALDVQLVAREELEALGPEGFLIRTFTPSRRQKEMGAHKQLIIASLTEAGALHSVYEFFDRYVNVRWLAPSATVTPRAAFTLNEIDLPFRPCFFYRSIGYSNRWSTDAAEYRRAHKLEAPSPPEGLVTGTFFVLLPPDRFFADHPEYYAEIDGGRTTTLPFAESKGPHQLCCTNPETVEALVAELLTLLRAPADTLDAARRARRETVLTQGGENLLVIAPMPWPGACECVDCRALEKKEGSAAAPLLLLVNRVAEAVERAFPDARYRVATLCSGVRRRPPATLRPRPDVAVYLSTDGCDMGRPLDDAASPPNAAFIRDLKAWAAISRDLRIWDHAGNLENPLRPHPDLHVFRRNFLCYDQNRVSGVHVQTRAYGVNAPAEIDTLRAYVVAKALWDPDFPWEQARDDFLTRYYGPQGAAVRNALALIAERARKADVYLHPYQDAAWLDFDTVTAANGLLDAALAAQQAGERRDRLETAQLSFAYAAMVCPPKVTIDGDRLVLERPPCADWDAFAGQLSRLGAGTDTLIAQCADACEGSLAPRRMETPVAVLENEHLHVWLTPMLDGRIVRCVDKATSSDLVKNPFARVPDTALWREWNFSAGEPGAPAAMNYEVVAQDTTSVVMRATTQQGLTLERRITLDMNESALSVVMEIRNATDHEATPMIGLRASFETQALLAPELCAEWNGTWTRLSGEDNPLGPLWNARSHRLTGVRAWAVQPPGGKCMTSTFTCSGPDSVMLFYCQYDPRKQRVILDFPRAAPLPPGASSTVEVRYTLGAEPPVSEKNKPLWRL